MGHGHDPTGPATVAGPDLRQMRCIVKVAQLGGFTAAAGELHVAQQAVSQQVRATERMLGVTLEALPGLAVRARGVFAGDVPALLLNGASSSRSHPGARYPTVLDRNLSARSRCSPP